MAADVQEDLVERLQTAAQACIASGTILTARNLRNVMAARLDRELVRGMVTTGRANQLSIAMTRGGLEGLQRVAEGCGLPLVVGVSS